MTGFVKTKKGAQFGTSSTATDNFVIQQPTSPDGSLRISNGNIGATTDLVAVTSAGNVGVGTSSPGFPLSIYSSSAQIAIQNASTGSSNSDGSRFQLINSDLAIVNREAASIQIYTSDTERARIDSSGNLLVGGTGTTPVQSNTAGAFSYRPAAQLEVNGNATQAAFFGRTNDGMVVGFYSGGTRRGSVDISGATTSYVTSSDYRLKENITPMQNALDTVAQLNPVTWSWKEDGAPGQGFIAHELAEVCPDAVSGEKDAVDEEGNPQYQGVDTSFLVGILTKAIQELNAKVDAQAAEIAELKGQ